LLLHVCYCLSPPGDARSTCWCRSCFLLPLTAAHCFLSLTTCAVCSAGDPSRHAAPAAGFLTLLPLASCTPLRAVLETPLDMVLQLLRGVASPLDPLTIEGLEANVRDEDIGWVGGWVDGKTGRVWPRWH